MLVATAAEDRVSFRRNPTVTNHATMISNEIGAT